MLMSDIRPGINRKAEPRLFASSNARSVCDFSLPAFSGGAGKNRRLREKALGFVSPPPLQQDSLPSLPPPPRPPPAFAHSQIAGGMPGRRKRGTAAGGELGTAAQRFRARWWNPRVLLVPPPPPPPAKPRAALLILRGCWLTSCRHYRAPSLPQPLRASKDGLSGESWTSEALYFPQSSAQVREGELPAWLPARHG